MHKLTSAFPEESEVVQGDITANRGHNQRQPARFAIDVEQHGASVCEHRSALRGGQVRHSPERAAVSEHGATKPKHSPGNLWQPEPTAAQRTRLLPSNAYVKHMHILSVTGTDAALHLFSQSHNTLDCFCGSWSDAQRANWRFMDVRQNYTVERIERL